MSARTAIWVDGSPASELPLPDRGLDFGDGLFETLLLAEGRPLHTELHLERLESGLHALGFPDCLPAVGSYLQQAATDIVRRAWQWTALRLTVTRGAGPRGYTPPQTPQPRIVIVATRIERDCRGMASPATVSLASIRFSSQPALARIKHLNRLEQVLAAAQCAAAGADDALMLDQRGTPVSLTAGNLFLLEDGKLLTPPITDCGIEGTRRRLLQERWAPALGLAVECCALTLEQVESAAELFYCNSLVGLRPIASFRQTSWQRHEVCEALHRQYLEGLA